MCIENDYQLWSETDIVAVTQLDQVKSWFAVTNRSRSGAFLKWFRVVFHSVLYRSCSRVLIKPNLDVQSSVMAGIPDVENI